MAALSDLSFRVQGLWLAHKIQLKRVWVIVIIAAEVLVFAYAGAMLVVLLADAGDVDRAISQQLDSLAPGVGLTAREPQDVTFGTAAIVPTTSGRADIFVPVKNENARWYLRDLRYRLQVGGTTTADHELEIFPGTERVAFALNQAIPSGSALQPSDVHVEVLSTDWEFLENQTTLDQATFTARSLAFSPIAVGGVQATRLTGEVVNTGIFTYRNVGVQIVVLDGTRPVGVTTTSFSSLAPGQVATFDVTWRSSFPSGVTARVVPSVDLSDPTNVSS